MPQDDIFNPLDSAPDGAASAGESIPAEGEEGTRAVATDGTDEGGSDKGDETVTPEDKAKAEAEAKAEASKGKSIADLRRREEKARRDHADEKSKREAAERKVAELEAKRSEAPAEGGDDLVTRKDAEALADQKASEHASKVEERLRNEANIRESNTDRRKKALELGAEIKAEYPALIKKYIDQINAKIAESPEWAYRPDLLFHEVVPKAEIKAADIAAYESRRMNQEDEFARLPQAPAGSGGKAPQQEPKARTKQAIAEKVHRVANRLMAQGRR